MAKRRRSDSSASVGTPATVALTRAGVAFTVHPYDRDPAADSYGLDAAEALGVDPERVLKTLVAQVDDTLTVAVVPVSGSLDLKALARAIGGKKAIMADVRSAERATGYVAGGISPLGQRTSLPTVIDTSASNFTTVFVSGGKRGVDLELAPADLAHLTSAVVASIRRG